MKSAPPGSVSVLESTVLLLSEHSCCEPDSRSVCYVFRQDLDFIDFENKGKLAGFRFVVKGEILMYLPLPDISELAPPCCCLFACIYSVSISVRLAGTLNININHYLVHPTKQSNSSGDTFWAKD